MAGSNSPLYATNEDIRLANSKRRQWVITKKEIKVGILVVGRDLANFDLFFFVFSFMLSGHMIPQPVPGAEREVAVRAVEAKT